MGLMLAERGEDRDHAACAGDDEHARAQGGAGPADAARVLLADLQRSAAESLAAITAADAALRALAARRVTAERAVRLAAARHQTASRAAAAHARARPGPLAQLATRFRAGREWRRHGPALEGALATAERRLAAASQALSEAKEEFTVQFAARATAAATLRRLTAECAAALAQIAALDGASPPGGGAAAILRHRDENR